MRTAPKPMGKFMCFLGRAVLFCALVAPGTAAATAESFTAPTAVSAIGQALRDPAHAAELRDTRLLDHFYRALGYRMAWADGSASGQWSEDAHQLVSRLALAQTHGLDPADYRPDRLAALLAQPVAAPGAEQVDVELSVALLRYLDHVNNGRIQPSAAGWDVWYRPGSRFAVEAATALAAGRLDAYLDKAGPADARYRRLRQMREHFVALAAEPYPLLGDGPTLRPNDRDPEIAIVRRQLTILGDLDPVPAPAGPAVSDAQTRSARQWQPARLVLTSTSTSEFSPDSAGRLSGDANQPLDDRLPPVEPEMVFDPSLEAGVQAFQRRHGLTPDGLVGPATRRALDITPAERLRQIDLGLERIRWLPADLGERHVVVNIPSAELFAIERGAERLRMRVVTGLPDWKTPVFSDEIVNLKFAPTWTVPYSIVRDEKLPRIRRDPGYLARNSMRVLWQGEEVDPWSVDWHNTGPGDFILRQDSGPASALGGVRFSLTNNFGIYLHDTPSKRHFARASRALSHGCVRVGDPVALSLFLLERQGGWDAERVKSEMSARQERYHRLQEPVPVHMIYLTAWIEDGRMEFRNDVYGYDKRLSRLLDARRSQAS